MAKPKRRIWHLRWDKRERQWRLDAPSRGFTTLGKNKRTMETYSRRVARRAWKKDRIPVQLLIHRKDGAIARGGRSEASYGYDSRRRRG